MRNGLRFFPSFTTFNTVRNYFSCPFDEYRVADMQTQPLDFIHVVERGTADSDASDLHRLQHGKPV